MIIVLMKSVWFLFKFHYDVKVFIIDLGHTKTKRAKFSKIILYIAFPLFF